ncbi:MAG: hypothetical protein CME63_07050 [Halobacteriovoraceae bacterium]|nr:hypothetical protein [Halobacteriovoraceae bacterium]
MEMIKSLYIQYHQIFRYISKTNLFGWLPLDGLLHFLAGLILMIIFNKWLKKPTKRILLILGIQIFKEILDSFALTATWEEALIDTALTLVYPVISLLIFYFQSKQERDLY